MRFVWSCSAEVFNTLKNTTQCSAITFMYEMNVPWLHCKEGAAFPESDDAR